MARPRTASDEEILAAVHRAVSRVGPLKLTLADVAGEVGLSAGALVQRFGSKRGLLLAVASTAASGVASDLRALRRAHPSPLDALTAAATGMARAGLSAEALAHHLAFLQLDIADPEFRTFALEFFEATHAGYTSLIEEAVAAGELRPCHAGDLAHAVAAVSGGSIMGWAVWQKGRAARWVRRDLETLLAPYRRSTGPRPRRSAKT